MRTSVIVLLLVTRTKALQSALIAAFIVGIVESFAYQYVGDLNLVVVFLVMGIIIYFRPGGLMGKPLPIPGQ